MKAIHYLLSICATACAGLLLAERLPLVLDEANFDGALASNQELLVLFHTPQCSHCKSLVPEWAKLETALRGSPTRLGDVDVSENQLLAKRYHVKGFPTIKLFESGQPIDYNGGRAATDIVNWLNKMSTGSAAATLTTEEDLTKFQETHDAFALGLFDSVDFEAARRFLDLANSDSLHFYAISTSAAIKSALAVTADSVIVLKSFDDLRADFAVGDTFVSEDVQQFVLTHSTPLVQAITALNTSKIFAAHGKQHVLFFTDKAADHHAATLAAYTAAAASFRDKLMFWNVLPSADSMRSYAGISDNASLPAMSLVNTNTDMYPRIYRYEGLHDSETIAAFANSFLGGHLKPHLKSEEVSAEDTAGDVVVLKGKSFADLVLNNDKDVLVMFYAPWGGHCKHLMPTIHALATKLKMSHPNVVIAKMDYTANEIDVPGVSVKGFPTLYFFKGNDKAHPVRYIGERDVSAFIAFLEENGALIHTLEEL